MDTDIKPAAWRRTWVTISAGSVLLAFYWLTYAFAHDFNQKYLRSEDKLIEWITALSFLSASVILARLSFITRKWSAAYLACIAVFFFVCAGEEMSWGQRIIGFETPESIRNVNEQNEFNLHNLKSEIIHPKDIVATLIKLFGIVAPLVAWNRWPKFIPLVAVVPVFVFGELLSPVRKLIQPWANETFSAATALELKLDTAEFSEMMWGVAVFVAALAIRAAWKQNAESTADRPGANNF